jgi:transcriptional regulator with XRE-family HTH domain
MSERDMPDVGSRLRTFRHDRGLSLRALAALCEVSPNTISLIERGITSPSVSTLQRLATALGTPITDFFIETEEPAQVILTPADKRPRAGSASVVLESLGSGLEDQLCEPYVVTMKAGASSGDRLMAHPGQELAYCLEGELDYEIDGDHYHLKPGDALLFRGSLQSAERVQESVEQHLHP